MQRIALAKWQPDLFGLANNGQSDTLNVYPTGSGYAPLRALSPLSTTGLDGRALGAIATQDSNGSTVTFAGDATDLYQFGSNAFDKVSKVAGEYNVGTTERWEFAAYGQRVIATNIGDVPQYFDLDSSSAFDDLPGAPEARHIAVVRDFVVLGNTTAGPNIVTWSGFNDSEGWTPGVNQSDSQILAGGGWIQAITGGEVGYIFQQRAITRMSYVGPPVYFQFDTIELARGLAAPGALVQLGGMIYYLASDGFYAFDGNQSIPIGNQKVDRWFAANLRSNTLSQITAGSDPANKLLFWSFVSNAATSTDHPDTMLVYNWLAQEWSYARIDHQMVYPGLTAGSTLEQIGELYEHIEDVPVSLDSLTWTGGTAFLAGFDTTNNLGSFEGDTLAATLQTGDFEAVPGRRSLITGLRPLADAAGMTALVKSRERFADSVTATTAAAMQDNGDIPLLSSGRFHQAQLSVPAGAAWSFANGLDVDARDDGEQ